MPIIEALFDQNAHLSQGDILKGVSLFFTAKTWEEGGGIGKKTDHPLCIVVSRPCVAAHKERVIVSAIEKYKNKRPDQFESLEEARYYYEDIRDGYSSPDQFYLGQIPGYDGSYCARLDSLHTIQVPADGQARPDFTSRFRIAVLNKMIMRSVNLKSQSKRRNNIFGRLRTKQGLTLRSYREEMKKHDAPMIFPKPR